jgi:hypothetical protein
MSKVYLTAGEIEAIERSARRARALRAPAQPLPR